MFEKNTGKRILKNVAEYYTNKLAEYGDTPLGVDWSSEQGQQLLFEQISKIIKSGNLFTLSDLGCGYGALYSYLSNIYNVFDYYGYDISEEMISSAKLRYCKHDNALFFAENTPTTITDYTVASGIFNVKLSHTENEWEAYILETLNTLNASSKLGFSFNCLTKYSDADKMRHDLYYADPCFIFDYCKRHFSKDVALLHDYGLYEFTILVRK